MRVGLLQIDLDRASRSRNLQRIIAAIHLAAQHRPAPDLLVLPSACDTGGALAQHSFPRAEVAGVAAVLSWEARDWGIYIVCGLHESGREGRCPRIVLFDADGDVIASTGDSSGMDSASHSAGVAMRQCLHGRIILAESVAGIRKLPPAEVDGAFVAVPLPHALEGTAKASEWAQVGSLVRPEADRGGAYWGLVAAPGADAPCTTCVLGPSGPPIAAAKRGVAEVIVMVDVPIEPPRATALGSSGRGDQAD